MTVLHQPKFFFDFGSPNAYLSHVVIPQIEARTGTKFEYVPILLGGLFKLTGNRSPAEAFAGIKNKPEYDRLETERFVRRHDITSFRHNPHWPVNTLQIMRGAVAAQLEGCFEHYVRSVYRHMWEQGLKMDDPATIVQALNDAGLASDKLIARSQTPEVKERLLANTQDAFNAGAFGSPSFLVGDELFFGKDKLADVEQEIVRRSS
ncbi:2-hydroxychromene-2-carboxylate isomerase [Variovorax paradoxus]|nr:2-hydroxychromene-2-carboxylate isomerase [Variovorax paradoxus]MBT2302072.1 2-hydroxychromene-2-carboxylate isomerase [Variovorax paradoxus]